MDSEEKQTFSEEAMENFAGLYDVLLRVYCRLLNEGYTITDDKIIPPPDRKR